MTHISANTRCCGTILYGLTLAIAGAVKLGYDYRQNPASPAANTQAQTAPSQTAPPQSNIAFKIATIDGKDVYAVAAAYETRIVNGEPQAVPTAYRTCLKEGDNYTPYLEETFENRQTLETLLTIHAADITPHFQSVNQNFTWNKEFLQLLANKIDTNSNDIITEQELKDDQNELIRRRQTASQNIRQHYSEIEQRQ